ncbi:hypothetical protein KQX54_020019 [Cotesia glomerata]|uniref:Uncharacterized protein n=1 Tax=Cotesia glomerata TaxID=32391 RepID=A0AAV7I4G1_COTGL|nr:hypothetical protein KQX54_020019 [Cotesia glomerata]
MFVLASSPSMSITQWKLTVRTNKKIRRAAEGSRGKSIEQRSKAEGHLQAEHDEDKCWDNVLGQSSTDV